jgi:hypothetical protein
LSNVLSLLDLSNTRFSVYLENDLISNLKSLEYMFLRNCNIFINLYVLRPTRKAFCYTFLA